MDRLPAPDERRARFEAFMQFPAAPLMRDLGDPTGALRLTALTTLLPWRLRLVGVVIPPCLLSDHARPASRCVALH